MHSRSASSFITVTPTFPRTEMALRRPPESCSSAPPSPMPGAHHESPLPPGVPVRLPSCGSSTSARFFVLHDAVGISPEVKQVLDPWVRGSGPARGTVQDIRALAEYDGYYYNQFLVVRMAACTASSSSRRRVTPQWAEALGKLSRVLEQNPMSSKPATQGLPSGSLVHYWVLGFDSYREKPDVNREWGFEKLIFRNSIKVRRDRKYAIQARNEYSAGVHMLQNLYGRTNYHYHNSINFMGEPCREFVPMPVNSSRTIFEGVPSGASVKSSYEKIEMNRSLKLIGAPWKAIIFNASLAERTVSLVSSRCNRAQ
ncbi:hypothetical protein U9M48_005113, partial [Paspalum notatum var. saurae]